MTERTDFQAAELDEPDEPDEDELPWDDVDLDGAGAFAEGVELCSVTAAADVVDAAFGDADVCSAGVDVLFFDGEA